jgi:hypothetical protein
MTNIFDFVLQSADDACNNKAYYLSRHLKGNFPTAHLFCKNFGMNLATLTTLEEYNNFKSVIIKLNRADVHMELFFVGGTRVGAQSWYWLSGGNDLAYKLNWGEGEPNNPVKEQCLSFYANNGALFWNDMTCDTPAIRFLCEKFL